MKKAYIFGWILAAAMLLPGCTGEEKPVPEEKGGVQVRIALDGLMTKTTTPGEGAENTVSCLDVIVFSADGTQQLYSWLHGSYSIEGGYYVYSTTVDGITAISGTPAEKAEVLQNARVLAIANYPGAVGDFSGKTLEQVQALALEASSASAAAGKFICLATADRYSVLDTPSFVMTGLTAAGNGFAKTGEGLVAGITLKRLAAKVSLTLTYPTEPITTDGHDAGLSVNTKTVWEPMLGGNTRIYLENGALDALLGGAKAKGTQTSFAYTDTYPSGDPLVSGTFYTYPLTWDEGSSLAPFIKIIQPWHYRTVIADEGASQGTVIDENVVELYYKVMFPGLTALESNTWYKPTVQLSVLGGEASRPTVLNATGLDILAWGSVVSGTDVSEIEIQPVKYLTVEREATTVTNGNKVQVRYFASGPATLTVNRIYKDAYSNDTMVEREIYPDRDMSYHDKNGNGSPDADEYYIQDIYDQEYDASTKSFYSSPWFSNTYNSTTQEGIIMLNHEISTKFGHPSFAARPYIYHLNLSLDGGGVPDQSFTITQIPSILVEGEMSDGYVNVDNNETLFGTIYRKRTSTDPALTGIGNVQIRPANYYINMMYRGFSSTDSNIRQQKDLGSVNTYIDIEAGSATNICQYRIIVSSIPHEGVYIVDPRISSSSSSMLNKIINQHKEGYSSSASTDKNNFDKAGNPLSTADEAKIAQYLPGNDAVIARDYIAPEFMFASSYGRTNSLRYESAVLRCLAYQEDGYPAGRWRLPTEAEISMCIKLQDAGAIPTLFNATSNYVASSGRGYKAGVYSDMVDTEDHRRGVMAFPRCVYDTWYWGRDPVNGCYVDENGDGYPDTYTDATGTYPKYKWSGYNYTAKP